MKKRIKWIVLIIILILILILLFMFLKDKKYTVYIDTDGGSVVSSVKLKKGEIFQLPDIPTKEGYVFSSWIDENNNIITEDIVITKDTTIKSLWISEDKKIKNISFEVEDGKTNEIKQEEGKNIVLPIEPVKEGYKFAGWINEDGYIITNDMVITDDIKIYAKWISNEINTITINFDTNGGKNIGNIVVENEKIISFPITPVKEGYVFFGWVDENGNEINKDTIFDKNITLKAVWKDLYTCPSDCEVSESGKTCTKTKTTNLITYTGCPSGTETVEKFCSSHKHKVAVGFDEDLTYVDAGISCSGSPKNFCVDYKNRYTINGTSCPSGYYRYNDSDGLGVLYGCAKKYDKGGSSCPSGYEKENDKCVKTETIKCTLNKTKEY